MENIFVATFCITKELTRFSLVVIVKQFAMHPFRTASIIIHNNSSSYYRRTDAVTSEPWTTRPRCLRIF